MRTTDPHKETQRYHALPNPMTLVYEFPGQDPTDKAISAVGTWVHLATKTGWRVTTEFVVEGPVTTGKVGEVLIEGILYGVHVGDRLLVPRVAYLGAEADVSLTLREGVWVEPIRVVDPPAHTCEDDDEDDEIEEDDCDHPVLLALTLLGSPRPEEGTPSTPPDHA